MFAEAAWVACIVDFIIRPQYEHTGGHLYIHVSRNDKKRVKTDLGNVFLRRLLFKLSEYFPDYKISNSYSFWKQTKMISERSRGDRC